MTRSHKIGWLVIGLALLFMLWRLPRLHGQGFGSFAFDQPFLAKDTASVQSFQLPRIAAIGYRWVASDLSSNLTEGAFVSNWVARVGGYAYTNDTEVRKPIWSTNGVMFYGTNRLDSSWPGAAIVDSVLIVLKHYNITGNQIIIGTDLSGQGFLWISQADLPGYYFNLDTSYGPAAQLTTVDFLSGITTKGKVWTNGVVGWESSFNDTGHAYNTPWLGSSYMGNGSAYSAGFKGAIKEMVVWTNVGTWTVSEIEQIHQYCTNTYSYTP